MATGLDSLTQAVTDLTSTISEAVAEIASLSSQLSDLNSEDPKVAALAEQIETQVGLLKSAVTPATPVA
ncbi:MAG TPA: hypothetical protein VMQ76_02145 [Terracidiphilus sp.]|nr:hypothetical protein [Terracidiphilus sp.]